MKWEKDDFFIIFKAVRRFKVFSNKQTSRVRRHFEKKTDRQTFFFKKKHWKELFTAPSFFSAIKRHKNAIEYL